MPNWIEGTMKVRGTAQSKGCTHTKMDGHICMADPEKAIWMVGYNPESWKCEVYEPKEDA